MDTLCSLRFQGIYSSGKSRFQNIHVDADQRTRRIWHEDGISAPDSLVRRAEEMHERDPETSHSYPVGQSWICDDTPFCSDTGHAQNSC